MEAMGFLKIGAGEADADNDAADDPMDGASASGTKSTKHGYEHLLSMSLVRLTENRFQELQAEADKMQQALQSLQQKSECDLWREDLDAVEKELLKMKRQRMKTIEEELHAQPTASNTKKKKRAAKRKDLGDMALLASEEALWASEGELDWQ
ncbi:Top2b, partial [Symbiodinium sp. KB8]